MKRLVSSYFLSESPQDERSGIACICFYFILYVILVVFSLPNTSKVPEQDASNLTKAGFVITTSLQPASFRSGCKERLISKPAYDRGHSIQELFRGFRRSGIRRPRQLISSPQQKAGRQISRFYEIPSEKT